MKIAFCNRPGYDSPLGGDAIQMLETKENLESLFNVQIEVITDAEKITNEYDIVHIFNYATYNITENFFKRAQALHIPIVSSPIYWDYSYNASALFRNIFGYPNFISEERILFERRLATIYFFITNRGIISPFFKKKVKSFIHMSDMVLPNSKEEGDLLFEFAGIQNEIEKNKLSVVFNAVDNSNLYSELSESAFCAKYAIPTDYVLTVGRVEYVKNQLNLIYSLRNHPEIPIVVVGHNTDKLYFKKLMELSTKRGNVYFIPSVPHNEIKGFYRYARCHVLLSLRESPGLVSLEAQQQGCPIVVSSKEFAPTETYFGNCQFVVNPLRIKDIERAILAAYKSDRGNICESNKYTWEKAARQTYEAYKSVLVKKNVSIEDTKIQRP